MVRSSLVRRLAPVIPVLTLILTLGTPVAAIAQEDGRSPQVAEPLSAPEFRRQADWRASIALVPHPGKGCFVAKFPSKEWQEVPCVAAPERPLTPRGGVVPQIVGNGNDIAAQAPTGFISSAIGSFDSLTGVTSESGQIGATGPAIANAYTLQINTDFFTSTKCAGSPNAGCRGWEQFVFENNNVSHRAFIQYWLIKYNTTCPAGWTSLASGSDTYCYILTNSSGAVGTPAVPVTSLGQVTMTGTAGATSDSITVTIGGTAYSRVGDNAVNAGAGWKIAEFNILGDGGSAVGVGSQAGFNAGAAIVTRTRINFGGPGLPICVAQGFTAETNNFSFGPGAPAASGAGPALIFNQSIAGGSPSNCAASTAIGDTHLTTLGGLLYDFQATGDFTLLQTASGFLVQNRQVSGAPSWPDAAVNAAVAVRTGRTQVAVCARPEMVYVDRRPVTPRGKPIVTADGTQITVGEDHVYLIRGANGDWVRAAVNPGPTGYIDVKVGLGQWPIAAKGLLANVRNDVNLLATRDGKVMHNPVSFDDLYHPYASSWRVSRAESLLAPCGEAVKAGIPAKPFFAANLNRDLAERGRAICGRVGLKDGALLDACILDVAVIGPRAAAVYAKLAAPVAVHRLR